MWIRTINASLLVCAIVLSTECGGGQSSAIRLNGAGSTFAYPLYSKWAAEFGKVHPDVEIDYQSIGSGGGINLVTDERVDFGATDGPMTDAQLKTFRERRGYDVLHLPTALGADVPSYNVPGITMDLKFTSRALAGIFLGTIKRWNDPELTSANPGIALPNVDIVVVHRSDGSGTTYVWTDYLSKISDDWRTKVGHGNSVSWPVGTGISGNQGVAEMIKATPHAIGYVELTYAIREKLLYGDVQNSAGRFVRADFNSVTAAAAESAASMPDDFRVSITNAPGLGAYPIASFTWMLVPTRIADATKRSTIVAFLTWGLTDGQQYAEALSYARLPDAVIAKAKPTISIIQ
jgi:phosphate transport system substrate-binding protein